MGVGVSVGIGVGVSVGSGVTLAVGVGLVGKNGSDGSWAQPPSASAKPASAAARMSLIDFIKSTIT
jgi:hypothetical protein